VRSDWKGEMESADAGKECDDDEAEAEAETEVEFEADENAADVEVDVGAEVGADVGAEVGAEGDVDAPNLVNLIAFGFALIFVFSFMFVVVLMFVLAFVTRLKSDSALRSVTRRRWAISSRLWTKGKSRLINAR
jgi:hypothetical protein